MNNKLIELRGERFPRPALLKKFSDYYKKSVDELFFQPE